MQPRPLSVSTRVEGERHTISLAGELDMAAAPQLEGVAEQACSNEARELVLDLARLTFIDSSGLRAIIRTRQDCERHGCKLFLIPGPPAVQRLFALTGLLDRLPFLEPLP